MITRVQPGGVQQGWHWRGYPGEWVDDGWIATLPTDSGQIRSMLQLGETPEDEYDTSGKIRRSAIGSEEWWSIQMRTIGWQPLTYRGNAKGPAAGSSGGSLDWQLQADPPPGKPYASPRLAVYEIYDPKYAQRINGVLHTPGADNPYFMLWLRGERSSWMRLIAPVRAYADLPLLWVLHVRWGYEASQQPFAELWLNGQQVAFADGDPDGLNTRGVPNCDADCEGLFYSHGPYVWDLDEEANRDACDVDVIRTWYGTVRVGDEHSSYAEVAGEPGDTPVDVRVAARWHSEEATRELEAAIAGVIAHIDALERELAAARILLGELDAVHTRLVGQVTPRLYDWEGE